jgi:hypothetical protein
MIVKRKGVGGRLPMLDFHTQGDDLDILCRASKRPVKHP